MGVGPSQPDEDTSIVAVILAAGVLNPAIWYRKRADNGESLFRGISAPQILAIA
jgi:hypothetical protein